MTKPKLTELAKARVDPETKQNLEQLTLAFGHHDEADTVRAAFHEFIERHRPLLVRRRQAIGLRR
jgi:ABC-type enterochelin transport system substrate-binding protein